MVSSPVVSARPLVRPIWARWRFWLAILVALILAAVVIGLLGPSPGQALDPTSTNRDGSKALAQLLAGYGTRVAPTRDPTTGGGAVLVTEPDAFSDRQLQRLAASSTRLVLVRPGLRATHAVAPDLEPSSGAPDTAPSCSDPGALAAGDVDLPEDTITFAAARGRHPAFESCFGGALVVSGRVVLLGSAAVLENSDLGHRGVAALAVNSITGNTVSAGSSVSSASTVHWLSPGASAAGSGQVSIWTLFPPGARRVASWLILVGLIAVVWRARRLGPAVRERLPVVVRSAEIVEGHGRLYERAGARDRAAAALRSATVGRLTVRFALARDTSPAQLAATISARENRPAGEVWTILAGPPPVDDLELTRLAAALATLEHSTTREDAR